MRISIDEIMSKRKDLRSGTASIVKAAQAPASWDQTKRTARFVMNSQAVDRYGDVVVTAGIDTTEFEQNPVALLFHQSRSWPIGSWANLTKVLAGRPPRIEGDLQLLPSGGPVPEIDQCAWMIANGGIRACSIGFIPDWDNYELVLDDKNEWTGGIQFNASTLTECSVVSIPAAPAALIKDAGEMRLAYELLEDVLDNYVKTPEGLILPRTEYEAAHKELSGNPTSVVVEKDADSDADEPDPDDADGDEPDDDGTVTDDTEAMADETVKMLIEREVVFATELKVGEKTLGGNVVAKSIEAAEAIVAKRGAGETVIGARVPAEVEQKETLEQVTLAVDLTGIIPDMVKEVAEATQELEAAGKRVEGVFSSLKNFFGLGASKKDAETPTERVEPEIEVLLPEKQEQAPDAAQIEAIRARAAAARDRMISKGLIEG